MASPRGAPWAWLIVALAAAALVLAAAGAPGGSSAMGYDQDATEEAYDDVPATAAELQQLAAAAAPGASVPASALAIGQAPPATLPTALADAHANGQLWTLPAAVSERLAKLFGACGQLLSGAAQLEGVTGFTSLKTLTVDGTLIRRMRQGSGAAKGAAELLECVERALAGAFGYDEMNPIMLRVWGGPTGTTVHKDTGNYAARLCCRLRGDPNTLQPSADHDAGTLSVWLAGARHDIRLQPGDVFVLGRKEGDVGHLGVTAFHEATVDAQPGTEVVTLVMDLRHGKPLPGREIKFPPQASAFDDVPAAIDDCFGAVRSTFEWPAVHPAANRLWTTHPPDSAGTESAKEREAVLGKAHLMPANVHMEPAEAGATRRFKDTRTNETISKEEVLRRALQQAKKAATLGGLASTTTGTASVGEEGLKLQPAREGYIAQQRQPGKRAPPNAWLEAAKGNLSAARGASNMEAKRRQRSGGAPVIEAMTPEQHSILDAAVNQLGGAQSCLERRGGRQGVMAAFDKGCDAARVERWKPDVKDRAATNTPFYTSVDGYLRHNGGAKRAGPAPGTCAAWAAGPLQRHGGGGGGGGGGG
ncbi:hypothetical protein Rsub_13412, partial [Raphidocelis subcapitata]